MPALPAWALRFRVSYVLLSFFQNLHPAPCSLSPSLCETDRVRRYKLSLPRCHCKQSRNGVSEEHAVRRVTKSVYLVKSVNACLLITSHVKAQCMRCVANDFSRSLHMTNVP